MDREEKQPIPEGVINTEGGSLVPQHQDINPSEQQPTINETPDNFSVDLRNDGRLEERFPNLEIIDQKDEKPRRDRIPHIPTDTSIRQDPNELIWLTTHAVKRRLEVLLYTQPRLNVRSSGAVKETINTPEGSRSFEMNARKGVPFQELINVLQGYGFQFIEDAQGDVVMLVDATIPAKDNTDGRLYRSNEIKQRANPRTGRLYEAQAILPNNQHSLGLRPVDETSSHAIAISLKELFELHQSLAPVETFHFNRISPLNDYDNITSGKLSIQERRIMGEILDSIKHTLSKDETLREELNTLFTVPSIEALDVKSGDDHRAKERSLDLERSRKIYDLLLTRFGLKRPGLLSEGKYPYEPVFLFAERVKTKQLKNEEESLALSQLEFDPKQELTGVDQNDQLQKLAVEGGIFHDRMASAQFMLADLVWALKTEWENLGATQTKF